MVIFPNSKINIGLQVVQKRSDGFHDINTVFYPIPWTDAMEVSVIKAYDACTSKIKLETFGIPINESSENNLIAKAYYLLNKKFNLPPLNVKLVKSIPMGAGLGGGSADAAFFLKYLNNKLCLEIPDNQLAEMATDLGSDCSFFISNKPVYASGRGEIFSPVEMNLKGKFLVVVYPEVISNTALAYKNILPQRAKVDLKDVVQNSDIRDWKNLVSNDFENDLFKRFPIIREYKELFYNSGAIYASMSGSGSAVYGIFSHLSYITPLNISHKIKSFQL